MDAGMIGVIVIIVVQILGFSFWLGKLSQKVNNTHSDLAFIKKTLAEILQRVSRIEGRLEKK